MAEADTAVLVLEDGRTFHGESYGAAGTTIAEIVFATGMTGYQETLTDPSYRGQIVVQTAPHIGNTGVNDEDFESRRVWVDGYVVRDPSRVRSNWRSNRSLDDLLADNGIVGISGIDTRALTRHLRERGTMRAAVSSEGRSVDDLVAAVNAAPTMTGSNFLADVTTPEAYVVPGAGGEAIHRGCARPRHQGHDAQADGRTRHRGARAAVDVDPRRCPGRSSAGRRLPLERTG